MTNSNLENVQGKKNFRANNYERTNSRGRFAGNKDSGGFRIRLSDNEMKAVKVIQETFQLKSTVAVLGFSVRTLSEMIKDGELKDSISRYLEKNRNSTKKIEKDKNKAPDPFARPTKSQPLEVNNLQSKNVDEK
tara:strand:- start:337 stop:738 length:402 start_codon:yes stop_codon:yes gene_type:complete